MRSTHDFRTNGPRRNWNRCFRFMRTTQGNEGDEQLLRVDEGKIICVKGSAGNSSTENASGDFVYFSLRIQAVASESAYSFQR